MKQQERMGAEVGRVAFRIAKAVGCQTCGIGIAIDAVGLRYSCTEIEWWCGRENCSVSKNGLDDRQREAITKILATLPPVEEPEMPPAPGPDTRLPPEIDN